MLNSGKKLKRTLMIAAITVTIASSCTLAASLPLWAADYQTKAILLPPPAGETYILIEIEQKSLTLYLKDKPYKTYPLTLGKKKSPTPVGTWQIKRKARNWGAGFGSRWMELNVPWGLYGIHGTNKPWEIGTEASGGCIRLHNGDVEEVYDLVKKGTIVVIKGEIFSPFYEKRRILHGGHRGTDVMLLQKKLKALGYFKGETNGFFCEGTEAALKQFQKDHFFEVTGQVDANIYAAVGL